MEQNKTQGLAGQISNPNVGGTKPLPTTQEIAKQQAPTKQESAEKDVKPTPKILDTLKEKLPKNSLKKIGIGCSIFVGVLIAFALVYITGLDTVFFKLKMEGIVVNRQGLTPIENARIVIDGDVKAITDEEGYYKITGLNQGDLTVTIEAEGFFSNDVTVELSRTTSNYTNIYSFQLDSSENGTLKGKFLVDKIGYDFTEDRIVINEDSYTIQPDGSFEIKEISVGQIEFAYESASYVDIIQTLELQPGDNILKEIELEPSGDIDERFLDYITGLPISTVEIQANNIPDEIIQISEDGNLKIKDLDIGREYLLRISADSYHTRDYSITIAQGVNRIPNLEMVRQGRIFYAQGLKEDNEYQIFSSDYDGLNEQQETTLENLEPYAISQSENGNVKFLSNVTNLRGSSTRGRIPVIFELDAETNNFNQVTSNTSGLDSTFIDTSNTWFINVFKENRNVIESLIEIRNEDGSIAEEVTTISAGTVNQALVSHTSQFVYYVVENNNSETLFAWNNGSLREVASSSDISLEDIDVNGNIALFRSLESNGFYSLNSYNFATKEIRELDNNTLSNQFMFINESDNEFIYVDSFNNQETIYTFNIDNNQSDKLIDLQSRDEVIDMRIINSNLFYVSKNKGLSILNLTTPRSYVPVNSSIFVRF